MKTKEQMADEALEKEVVESGSGFLEKPYSRYRFHNGFLVGFEACEKIKDTEIKALKNINECNEIIIKELEAEIARLKDKYESKFLGRP